MQPPPLVDGPLATAMTTLANTPDHMPGVETQLVSIAKLAAERVAAATYASITALRGEAYTTVAVSDDLIQAIDDAQYADDAGPCLEALRSGAPVGVPDIDTTLQWPGFHEAAPRMGLHASVSVPLFAGRGHAVAVLNLYGHDRVAMNPLIAGISLIHEYPGPGTIDGAQPADLDPGGRELIAGYAASLDIRATVGAAIELIRTTLRCSADDAYLSLCLRAAGSNLAEAATTLLRSSF